MDQWVRDEPEERTTRAKSPAGSRASRARASAPADVAAPVLPADVAAEIRRAVSGATAKQRELLVGRMERAVGSFEQARFYDALRLGAEVVREAPKVPAVRRLCGLAAYRIGRWRDAVRHLDAYRDLTEDADVLPALMDSQRALGRHARVAEVWSELRRRSPEPEVLAEGRIVAAESLADRGDLHGAIEMLAAAGAARSRRNPADRHLRQWYVLADLYERVGDIPRARDLFGRVAHTEPDAYDVRDRLEALGTTRSRPRAAGHQRARGRERGSAAPPGRSTDASS